MLRVVKLIIDGSAAGALPFLPQFGTTAATEVVGADMAEVMDECQENVGQTEDAPDEEMCLSGKGEEQIDEGAEAKQRQQVNHRFCHAQEAESSIDDSNRQQQ